MKHFIYRQMKSLTVLFICILVTFPGTGSIAAGEEGLADKAKKEGKLLVYTSMNVEDFNPLLQEFQKKYPFIKTELYRTKSQMLLTRIVQETRAQRYNPDVITATFPIWNDLVKNDILMKYNSPEAAALPARMKDPDGYWTALYLQLQGMAYNTDMVPANLAPKTYDDLLNPRWKGKKLAMDYREQPWFTVMLNMLGKEKGLDFMRKLAAQDLYQRDNKTLLTQLLAAREFPMLANTFLDDVVDLKRRGAHVEWVPGHNPIPSGSHLMGIYSHAPRPNAAKLFIDFLLSDEGQRTLTTKSNKFPAKPGIDTELTRIVKGYEIHPVLPAMMSDYASINNQFGEIFWSKKSK